LVITPDRLVSFFPKTSISLQGEIEAEQLKKFLTEVLNSSKLVVISLVKELPSGKKALEELLEFGSNAGLRVKLNLESVYDATREFLPLREFLTDQRGEIDEEGLEKLVEESMKVWEEIVPPLVIEKADVFTTKRGRLKTL